MNTYTVYKEDKEICTIYADWYFRGCDNCLAFKSGEDSIAFFEKECYLEEEREANHLETRIELMQNNIESLIDGFKTLDRNYNTILKKVNLLYQKEYEEIYADKHIHVDFTDKGKSWPVAKSKQTL